MGACEAQPVTQKITEEKAWLNFVGMVTAVDVERDGTEFGHAACLRSPVARAPAIERALRVSTCAR